MNRVCKCLLVSLLAIPLPVAGYQYVIHRRAAFSAVCETLQSDMPTETTGSSLVGSSAAYKYRAAKMEDGTYTGPVCAMEFRIKKVSSPTGNIKAYLYTEASSEPSVQLTESSPVEASTLSTSYTWVSFEFPGDSVTNAYWAVLRFNNGDATDHIAWSNTDAYWANGDYTSEWGSSWTIGNQRKLTYKIFSP